MALKGNLRDFSATQLLNLINLARKTGTLTVENDQRAEMAFREGKLVYACLVDGQGNTLAHILERAGKLSREQVHVIETRANGTSDKQLGHLLVQAGFVTQSDIIQSVRQHLLEVAYRIISWAEGLFRFEANSLPTAELITIPIDLESVILEGTRRMQEWERLREEIPDLEASLRFARRPDLRLRNVHLTVEEWRVVSYINPRNTMRQIARANDLSDLEMRRIVYGLVHAGLIQVVPRSASHPSTPSVRPPLPTGQPVRAGSNGTSAANGGTSAVKGANQSAHARKEKRSLVTRLIDRIRSL